MPKIKDIIINDLIKTNMGGIRTQNPILSKESIDEGTLDEAIGLDSANKPVRGNPSDPGKYTRVYEVTNIKNISESILSALKAGDMVLKSDSTGKHAYIVSFKKDNVGLCLTYTDASVVETQSYDYTDGHWVYNSEDVTSLG